ncbi:MAG: lipopolysaccharide heptosyltransferase II [Deltaproteobacteria bacterium]|nr:lipopolysaccharide heptosyltransferase II [Deltaproteobacteria bacterium]
MGNFILKDARHILVRVPNWIGDAVLCEPAVRTIRGNFPDANITILAKPWVAPIFLNNPSVDECIEYDSNGLHKGIFGRIRLIKMLRKKRYDLAILFQNAFDATFLAFMAGIPETWGYSTDVRGFLLTKSVRVKDEIKKCHQIFYYMNLLEEIGLKVDRDLKPQIYVSDEESRRAQRFLEENGLNFDKIIIGINPGASYGMAKRWFPERFANIANRMIDEHAAQVIIFGSNGDDDICKEVFQKLKTNAINLCARTNLRELISIIKKCSLFITNDSGPMHISASLGVPTAAIFGSTDPALTSPIGDKVCVVKKDIECSPCFERECRYGHYRCMEMVSVEDVYNASVKFLNPNAK